MVNEYINSISLNDVVHITPLYHVFVRENKLIVMTIKPITGILRKRFVRDLVGSLTLGISLAYAYWEFHSVPKRMAYKEYRERRAIEDAN